MTTKEKIDAIHKDQYNDYAGLKMKKLQVVHSHLRSKVGDEKYLEFLETSTRMFPRPKYIVSNEVLAQINKA